MPTLRLQRFESRNIEESESRRPLFGWANGRIVDEENGCDLLRFSGYWRCPADRWLRPSGPQTGGGELQAGVGEMEGRHHLTFEIYEEGKITLQEYLSLVVFHKKRPFTRNQFRRFMFAQSKPLAEMIALVSQLKLRVGMKMAIASNEGRELNAYRIQKFKTG
jgi:hypothetical protein